MATNYDRRSLISPGNEHGTSTSPRKMFRKMKATVSDSICGSKGERQRCASPSRSIFFSISGSFRGILAKIIGLRSYLLDWHSREIIDRPLVKLFFFFNTVSSHRVVS